MIAFKLNTSKGHVEDELHMSLPLQSPKFPNGW